MVLHKIDARRATDEVMKVIKFVYCIIQKGTGDGTEGHEIFGLRKERYEGKDDEKYPERMHLVICTFWSLPVEYIGRP
ncbi:hypothetical protein CTI12_AA400480 [Artemisia annua]|uniref:Uncharacterized protein n=1 Tax=Artemisia annua TaxID=35608 RepID=A0A2U1MAT2_ARTAN|nr:hypothetical protein CTI12_AA400480 [Artemisia annua]